MSSIVLIGFMGCGKTSIGKLLSNRLQYTFIDTDVQIEQREQKKIPEIFETEGEESFRDMETAYLRELVKQNRDFMVISAGGGMVLRRENRQLLSELGTVFFLKASEQTLLEHLKNDMTRPLLRDAGKEERIHQLLQERKAIYETAGSYHITTDHKPMQECVEEILSIWNRNEE